MEDRLMELEVRVAYQQHLLAELDDVVRSFAKRVAALESELSEHRKVLAEQSLPVGPADDPPPHY